MADPIVDAPLRHRNAPQAETIRDLKEQLRRLDDHANWLNGVVDKLKSTLSVTRDDRDAARRQLHDIELVLHRG